MLKLRKILLCDYLYYIIFITTILLTILRLNIIKEDNYNYKKNTITGVVTKVANNRIYLKDKIIITTISNENTISIHLGSTLKVKGYFTDNNIFIIKRIKLIKDNKNIFYILKELLIKRLNNNSYLYTFLLGDKSLLPSKIKRSYSENGISHLFAISGMHISLLASILKKILSKIKTQEEAIFKITTIFLFLYLLLVGFSPSIIRGILFYILFTWNNICYFYIKKINIFLFILSLSLIINPSNIFDIGYQYSYSISFALLLKSESLSSKNKIISSLKVSIISFTVSIPITIYNFNQFNIMSIIYNLFFVPFISTIVFPFSLIVLIITPLEPIYIFITNCLEKISLFLSNISLGKIIFKSINPLIYIFYFILIILWLLNNKQILIKTLLVLLIIHYLLPCFDNNIYLKVIDVGQGDSLVLHLKNKNILVDTGGSSNKEILIYNTLPFLKKEGIKKIDYLILSHGDFDHCGEAINLVESFKVEKVIFNCGPYNDLEKELIKVLDKKKIKYYSCIQELNIDNNKLYFLQTKEYDNENDNSNVIYTELNGYKFMFMGDAGVEKEKDILDKYNLSDIDVLKVGHHGSKTSSGKEFIDEIEPKYSIISVGKNNRYGHPNKEVLDILKDSKIYRTDQDGSIMFKIKNNKSRIETCSP